MREIASFMGSSPSVTSRMTWANLRRQTSHMGIRESSQSPYPSILRQRRLPTRRPRKAGHAISSFVWRWRGWSSVLCQVQSNKVKGPGLTLGLPPGGANYASGPRSDLF